MLVREKKSLVRPRPLREGDRVGLVAPSSRPATPAVVAAAARAVREMGFEPVPGPHVTSVHGFMAGTDSERLADLVGFFEDDSIAGIFCITGGYGASHLLPYLNYESISRKPKLLIGSEENTVLLNALFEQSGLVTLHGPNLDQVKDSHTFNHLREAVRRTDIFSSVSAFTGDEDSRRFNQDFYCPVDGEAEGHLVGGSLTAFQSLLGTPYEPRVSGSILFLDDFKETSGILDRWFTSLYLGGHLHVCKAVALGRFEQCGPKNSHNMLSVMEVFADRLKYLEKVSCFGLPLGHCKAAGVVPIGIRARLIAGQGRIEFLEPALAE